MKVSQWIDIGHQIRMVKIDHHNDGVIRAAWVLLGIPLKLTVSIIRNEWPTHFGEEGYIIGRFIWWIICIACGANHIAQITLLAISTRSTGE